jgi:membrane-associated phospholipid phosphatase
MCDRFFPSVGLWIFLGVLALFDLLAMAATGFRLVGYGTAVVATVSAGAWGLGYFYSTIRPDARLATLGFAAAYLIPFTVLAAILSYVGTSLDRPLLDAQFARADVALGLDWMAVLSFSDGHPAVGTVLRVAYHSSMLQMVSVFIVLAGTRQLDRLAGFLTLFTATGIITVLASIVFPAAGAFVFHNPPAELRDVVGQAAGIWHLEHFEALRSGAMRTIRLNAVEGLITFPSFHTALAIITAWAFWRTSYLALPVLGISVLVIASTVPVGGHYFVDVLAGAAIAAACIAALNWRSLQGRISVPNAVGALPALLRTSR